MDLPIQPTIPVKSPKDSHIILTELATSENTDSSGYVTGGQILAWMDVTAGIVAVKHCGFIAVTVSMDSVHFLNPIKGGALVNIKSRITRSWKTSMEIEVIVVSECLKTGAVEYCCHGFFTFVGFKEGKPSVVPSVAPESVMDKRRYEEAESRRTSRKNHVSTWNLNNSMKSPDGFPELHSTVYPKAWITLIKTIMPQHANSLGITFGGQMMKWMEHAAFIAATKVTHLRMITVSVDALQFHLPTKSGDLVYFNAWVTRVFKSSVEVHIRVLKESLSDPRKIWTNDAFMTLASVDEEGKPVAIPAGKEILDKCLPEHREWYAKAETRKESRLLERKTLTAQHHDNWWKD